MGLSKPISEMTDDEVLAEITSLREKRAGRAAAIAAKRVAAAAPKEKKGGSKADDAITAMLRSILADELK